MADAKPEYRVEALAKGLRLLSLFTEQRPTWRVTDLAEAAGLPMPTAYRVVQTLTSEGYLDHLPGGDYRPGVRVLTLGGAALRSLDLVELATPRLQRLAAGTGETVNLAVLSGHSALYLDQVAGSSALQSHNWVGQRIPLHATSNGKVLLSGLDDHEIAAALPHLPRFTDHTITSRRELVEQLAEVRRLGYAVAVDELEMGLTAAAAPIRSAHGDIIASMSVSGATFRLDDGRLADAVDQLVAAAREVSFRLGWPGRE